MWADSRKTRMVAWGLTLLGLVIIGRLAWLTLDADGSYVALARSSRMQTIEAAEFSRGNIVDRKGESFTNRQENCLVVFPRLLNISEADLTATLKAEFGWEDMAADCYAKRRGSDAYCLRRGLSAGEFAELNLLIENQDWQGVFVTVLAPRYADDAAASHIIGYVGLPDAMEAVALAAAGRSSWEYIGQTGLEAQYDEVLADGNPALLGVGVDERGQQTIGELRYLGQQGGGVQLCTTLDRDYQRLLAAAMEGRNGGAVLLDVANGDILAAVSAPGYDQYAGQTETEGDVYVNKAFAYFPPASVFKLVLAIAALENELPLPEDFVCTGGIGLTNGRVVHCWDEDGHGMEDMAAALGNSCNPYFVALGQALGGKTISETFTALRLDRQQIIGYNVASKNDNLSFNPAVEGDLANVSIGENGVRLSPLLVAQLLAAIANDGCVVAPRLVQGIKDGSGSWVEYYAADTPEQVFSAETAETLRQMLAEAVINGTGKPVRSEVVKLAGKSGTAEDAGVWFAGFAPADEPRYALAVYLADGTSGGKDAGGVFKTVMEHIAILEGWVQKKAEP